MGRAFADCTKARQVAVEYTVKAAFSARVPCPAGRHSRISGVESLKATCGGALDPLETVGSSASLPIHQ
jgi:hypothetical protein